MLIIDAHLDISWNALQFERDQLLSVNTIRQIEVGMAGKSRGVNTVAAESGMHRMTLLRLLSSDIVAVHAGSKALALAYLAQVSA